MGSVNIIIKEKSFDFPQMIHARSVWGRHHKDLVNIDII